MNGLAHLLLWGSLWAPAPADAAPVAPADPTSDRLDAPSFTPPASEVPEAPDFLGQALAARSGGLTAAAVAERAASHSPALDVKEAEIALAAARVDQVTAAFAPGMNLSAGYTRLSDVNVTFGSGALVGALNPGPLSTGTCPDGSAGCVVDAGGAPVVGTQFQIPQVLDNFSLAASLSIPISDYVLRVFRGLQAARTSEDATRLARQAEERKVRTDAKVAYYNWLRAIAQIAVAEDSLRSAQARLEEAQVGFRVGVMTKSDLLRIEAATATVDNAVVTAKSFEVLARKNLAVMMDEPVRPYTVGESVLVPPRLDPGTDVDDLIAEAEVNRPELDVLNKNVRALRLGIKTERAGYYPRLDAFGDALYARPNPRFFPPTDEFNGTWQVGARLSYSINGAIQTRQRLKELKAQDRQLGAQLEQLRRGIELEVTQAWVDRANAVASIELARKARESSEAAYLATVAQFRAGKASVTDLISAQTAQVNAQLQFVNAHIDLRVAEAKLLYATGRTV